VAQQQGRHEPEGSAEESTRIWIFHHLNVADVAVSRPFFPFQPLTLLDEHSPAPEPLLWRKETMFGNRFLSFAATGYFLYIGILVVFVASKAVGIHGIAWIFPTVLAFSLLGSSWLIRRSGTSWKDVLRRQALFLSVIAFSGGLATTFYDMSFDGRWYHQEGIIHLKDGFDPLREHLDESALPGGLWSIKEKGLQIVSGPTWINHYPKASEITAAAVYAFAGDIEVAKLFNFLLAFGAVSLLVGLFQRRAPGKRFQNLLLAVAMVANPVVISQLWTFYVDGQLYLLLLGMAGFLLLHATEGSRGWLLLAGMVAIGLANTKFTGLIYAVAVVVAYCGYVLIRNGWSGKFRSTVGILSFSLFLGGVVVGYNPYVRNLVEDGHPFHPVMGRNRIDIVGINAPMEFNRLGRLEKFLRSYGASSSNGFDMVDGRLPPKIPFSFHPHEFMEAAIWDARVGGFGPFFGGLLVCALLAWSWGLVQRLRGDGTIRTLLGIFVRLDSILLFCLATAFVIPELWWARYVPQLWVVPFLCWLTLPGVGRTGSLPSIGLGASTAIALAGSLGILIASVVQNGRSTLILERDFERLRRVDSPLQVHFGQCTADRLKYADRSIPIRPIALSASMVGRFRCELQYGGTIRYDDEALDRSLKTTGGGRELLGLYLRDRFVAPVEALLHLKDHR
jgi:hypothetical protein